MHLDTTEQTTPNILRIQRMLNKIDHLHLPSASRRDLESILVRQVAKELDRLLPWQAGHGHMTTEIALRIGQVEHLDDEALHQLKLAALLHDIGLLMLPAPWQSWQGSLEQDVYVAVQNHPRLGAALLEPFTFLREAAIMIAHHHEHWDGSGYPYGLRGPFIPLAARILAVADAFDAIRVPGVSDPSLRDHIALRILRVASGTQFDPSVVELFTTLMEKQSHHGIERDNVLRGRLAYAHHRSQSGTPIAPTVQAEALASRWPQPPLLAPEPLWDWPNSPIPSIPVTPRLAVEDAHNTRNGLQPVPHANYG